VQKRLFNLIFVLLAFLLTCAAIATGTYFSAGLAVSIGSPSDTLVRTTMPVEDVGATEINRQAALELANNLFLVYTINPVEWDIVENNLNILKEGLDAIRVAYAAESITFDEDYEDWTAEVERLDAEAAAARAEWELQHAEALALNEEPPPLPEIPMHPPEPRWEGEALLKFADLAVTFHEPQQIMLVLMTETDFEEFWEAVVSVAEFMQTQEEIHVIDELTVLRVRRELGAHRLDRSTADLAEHLIVPFIRTNAIPNDLQNQINFEQTSGNYDRVMLPEGYILLDIGDIVTENVYAILDLMGLLAPDSILDNLFPMLGVFFLAAMLFIACVMYLSFYRPEITKNTKEAMLLFTLYVLTLSLVWGLSSVPFPFLPLVIFPLLVSILIDRRCATVLTFAVIIICYFIVDGDLTYLLFYSVAGLLVCLLSRFTTERGKMIWVGLLVAALHFSLSLAVTLIVERGGVLDNLPSMFTTAGFAALIGLLIVFLCTGSLPLWETFFGVVTPVKLLDLTNPTNLLLRRLTIEAPGTYHHSLIVANLAETAAYDIGADSHAARVGGYYHDVGKLKCPHYFVENLDGENPHDHMDPHDSAQLIMSHVSFGLSLAADHRLPLFVRDIIKEHHGTTLMQYFYSKAREAGKELEESDFRYPHIIPQTKESACVMLADSVEAAVRSMIPKLKSVDEVEKTIRFIIRGKLNDGQLADSQLSIRDVTVIEQSFFRVLKGMYHERIAYPAAKPAAPAEPEPEPLLARPAKGSA